MKLALCFFGITRSLPYTARSIIERVVAPSRARAETRILGHFFDLKEISNPRSGEQLTITDGHYDLLPFDELQKEEPELFLADSAFEKIKTYGDVWEDDFRSLKNLFHQLHSLQTVYAMSRPFDADVTLFLRPDLQYLDDFSKVLDVVLGSNADEVAYIPSWQSFGGLNDRFAITKGKSASSAYANRLEVAPDYCRTNNIPLHAEKLVEYALGSAGIETRKFNLRAMRVRANGSRAKEFFGDNLQAHLIGKLRHSGDRLSGILGLRKPEKSAGHRLK